MASALIEEIPDYSIKDGLVHIQFKGDLPPLCMPINGFRICIARCNRMLAEYDARSAEVVPIRKRRG